MKKYIVFNWKCHPESLSQADRLLAYIRNKEFLKEFEAFVCPPFVFLEKLSEEPLIKTCAQDCFWQEGPFTGEVSPLMLKSVKCDYVILGHSERKRLFGEDEKTSNRKLKAVLAAKLTPLLFFGEEEKLAIEGARQEILRQLRISLSGVDKKALPKILFVYEPAYAISTQGGQVLTLKEIEEKIGFSRKTLGEKAVVLYGGSVDESNIKEYLGKTSIDGVVIGQASLDPKRIKKIVEACLKKD